MTSPVKFLIGLAAALLAGWLWHGPLGNGGKLIDALEGRARTAVAETEVAGIGVTMARDPMARSATLSGPANQLQREGLGSQMGVSDYVRAVDGITAVRWADEPPASGLPLLIEAMIFILIAFLIGLGGAWLLWGRPKRESYL